jgi:hypothetical protein
MPRPINGGLTTGNIDSAVHVAPVLPIDVAPIDVAPMDVTPIDDMTITVARADDLLTNVPMHLTLINTAPVVYEPQPMP